MGERLRGRAHGSHRDDGVEERELAGCFLSEDLDGPYRASLNRLVLVPLSRVAKSR